MKRKVLKNKGSLVLKYTSSAQNPFDARLAHILEQQTPRIFLEFAVNPLSPMDVEVLFDVTRMVALADHLKRPLDGDGMRNLFTQLAELLGTCVDLGLPLKNVLLDAHDAYYDSWSGSLRFIYLPFEGLSADARKTRAFFAGLAKRMSVVDEAARALQVAYEGHFMQVPGFNPVALRSFLLEASGGRKGAHAASAQGAPTIVVQAAPAPISQVEPSREVRAKHVAPAPRPSASPKAAPNGLANDTTVLTEATAPFSGRHVRLDPGTGVLDAIDWDEAPSFTVFDDGGGGERDEANGVNRKEGPSPAVVSVEPPERKPLPLETTVLDDFELPSSSASSRFWLTRQRTGERFEVRGERFVVGKSKYSSYQVRDTTTVSRSHAIFTCADGECWIEDDASKNGTTVDGEPLAPHVRKRLRNGAVIRMSDEDFAFEAVRF